MTPQLCDIAPSSSFVPRFWLMYLVDFTNVRAVIESHIGQLEVFDDKYDLLMPLGHRNGIFKLTSKHRMV